MAHESIYSWIKVETAVPEKPPMYHSKHPSDPTSTLYGSTLRAAAQKKSTGVIGRELKGQIKPSEFLRAHEKTGHVSELTSKLRE